MASTCLPSPPVPYRIISAGPGSGRPGLISDLIPSGAAVRGGQGGASPSLPPVSADRAR